MSAERTYMGTHPWLTFALDLGRLGPMDWILLGEAASKGHHIAGVPLDHQIVDKLVSLYLAKGALATAAIEGNTLTEQQAQDFLAGELKLPPSQEYLGVELQNIVDACNAITKELAARGPVDLTPELILWMNAQVLHGLTLSPEVSPGHIRTYSVGVPGYRGAPHEDCALLLQELCRMLNQAPAPTLPPLVQAIIKAVVAHLYIAWIHPFGDGNGRTARLLEFYILLSSGWPQPCVHLLSNHYNKTRHEYYRQLDAARHPEQGPYNFLRYASQGLVDGLKEQLELIRKQQWEVAWKDHVYESFRHKSGPSARRQRDLILGLSKEPDWVAVGRLHELSPSLVLAYAEKTSKALSRDLNSLVALDLIVRTRGKVRARKEKLVGYWRSPVQPDQIS